MGARILARDEGIIPALESAHAIAYLSQAELTPEDRVVVIVSGRGDKDMETYIKSFGEGISDEV
jgi:tryptophan synthase beta chain